MKPLIYVFYKYKFVNQKQMNQILELFNIAKWFRRRQGEIDKICMKCVHE